MSLEFVLIVVLAAWVGVCEIRIRKLEDKCKKDSK